MERFETARSTPDIGEARPAEHTESNGVGRIPCLSVTGLGAATRLRIKARSSSRLLTATDGS